MSNKFIDILSSECLRITKKCLFKLMIRFSELILTKACHSLFRRLSA
ncbi:Uncharacterized protein dnm_064460 [Desulfonema magnum]|uniref:Uncharacterized protein n=1 Tax=Desulfonema magnum TaxID=45655 RepID=A0A975BSS2_9BACT|nr:Uncharacterized protein dnm_064460 [Desulfonema magnum]